MNYSLKCSLALLSSKYHCPNLPSDFWGNRSPQVFWRRWLWLSIGQTERLAELTWKSVLAPCNLAGLRGATGLRVLQKWILESKGLGVSKMGVCKTHGDKSVVWNLHWVIDSRWKARHNNELLQLRRAGSKFQKLPFSPSASSHLLLLLPSNPTTAAVIGSPSPF